MKKFIALLMTSAFVLTGCGSSGQTTEEAVEKYGSATLKFYNWGEYIGE